jgi:hypothetical protein
MTDPDQLRADAETWRRKAISRALTISRLRGTIDALTDLADEPVTDPGPRGDGYRAAIVDLREVLREFGHLDREAASTPAPADIAICCVCGGGSVVYRNFHDQLFCWPCADCQCAGNPCVRTGINDPAVSQSAARADRLATALAEVLACLYALTRVDGSVIAWQTGNPIRPALYDRWQAALQPAAPQPAAPETGHDSGPDVAECAAADRNWDVERHGE